MIFVCKGKTKHQRTEKASEVVFRNFFSGTFPTPRHEIVWVTWLVLKKKIAL